MAASELSSKLLLSSSPFGNETYGNITNIIIKMLTYNSTAGLEASAIHPGSTCLQTCFVYIQILVTSKIFRQNVFKKSLRSCYFQFPVENVCLHQHQFLRNRRQTTFNDHEVTNIQLRPGSEILNILRNLFTVTNTRIFQAKRALPTLEDTTYIKIEFPMSINIIFILHWFNKRLPFRHILVEVVPNNTNSSVN